MFARRRALIDGVALDDAHAGSLGGRSVGRRARTVHAELLKYHRLRFVVILLKQQSKDLAMHFENRRTFISKLWRKEYTCWTWTKVVAAIL